MHLNELTLIQAIDGLSKKQFSSVELTQSCLDQIKKTDDKIRAFVTVCEKESLDAARNADIVFKKTKKHRAPHASLAKRAGKNKKTIKNHPLLLGIPVSVKDIFNTKDILTTAASNILNDYISPYDATVVRKLKASGAIIIGKTNMDAFAHGSSTETSDFFVTRNPINTDYLPGGSSGGAAASVTAHQCIAAIGTETAGSIRGPASWCGVVGLKPAYGRVSRYGVIAMASSFDCPGPLTKTVEDAALILQILAGKDKLDATTANEKITNYLKNLLKSPRKPKPLTELKIGLCKEYFTKEIQLEVKQAVLQAAKKFEELGAKVVEISLLDPKYSIAVYTILQRSEVSSNLARYDGIRFGNPRSAFGEEAKKRIMLGTYTLSAGYYDQYYAKAQKVRTLICQDFDKAFKKVDVIIGPTMPITAPKIGARDENSGMFGELMDILTEPAAIAGLPAISIPVGKDKMRLPIGLQIIGPKFREDLILKTAYVLEQTL